MIVIASSEHLYMGNKLLQFATFIGFAEEYKIKIANPSFAPYAHYFKNISSDFFCSYPPKKSSSIIPNKIRNLCYKVIYHFSRTLAKFKIENNLIRTIDIDWERKCDIHSPEFLKQAKSTAILFVMGWQFEDKINTMKKHGNAIRNYFQPLDKYQKNISILIENARKNADILIGVHIRHGDYKTFQGGKYFYDISVYINIMRNILSHFPNKKIKFLVCSNASQSIELFHGLNICNGTGHPVEDMYAFSKCDYILGPPSTYTMWASFYGNAPLYMIENAKQSFTISDFKVCKC